MKLSRSLELIFRVLPICVQTVLKTGRSGQTSTRHRRQVQAARLPSSPHTGTSHQSLNSLEFTVCKTKESRTTIMVAKGELDLFKTCQRFTLSPLFNLLAQHILSPLKKSQVLVMYQKKRKCVMNLPDYSLRHHGAVRVGPGVWPLTHSHRSFLYKQ